MKNNSFARTFFICEHFAAVFILYTTLDDKDKYEIFLQISFINHEPNNNNIVIGFIGFITITHKNCAFNLKQNSQ